MKNVRAFVFAVIILAALPAFAQRQNWLDRTPITNWNTAAMSLPRPDRRNRPQIARCRQTVRPATFAADRLLIQNGMFPVGPGQVYGNTIVVTATRDFDGMCRPVDFQTFVFRGTRVVGTLSPQLMSSRTDGALIYVHLFGPNELEAEYARYSDTDALCCPSRTQKVRFELARGLLRPERTDDDASREERR